MKLEDMAGHFSNWWGFTFVIAQAFQLFNIAGYGLMEFTFSSAVGSTVKAYYAMGIISTVCYFLVPISVFIFNCKQMAFSAILLGTLTFIVQMGIHTSFNLQSSWQFGVGWAGVGNGIVATIYMYFNDKVENEDKTMNLSSLFNSIAFFADNIANMGFVAFAFNSLMSTYDKANVIIGVLGFAFCGLAMIFSIYECKYLKLSFTALTFLCNLVAMAMVSKGWVVGSGSSTGDNAMAFGWISWVFSFAALIMILIEKKSEKNLN